AALAAGAAAFAPAAGAAAAGAAPPAAGAAPSAGASSLDFPPTSCLRWPTLGSPKTLLFSSHFSSSFKTSSRPARVSTLRWRTSELALFKLRSNDISASFYWGEDCSILGKYFYICELIMAKQLKKRVFLVASGDLRLSANQVCWPAQKQM